MSYDLALHDPATKAVLKLASPHQMRGGTYQVGGSTEASLNITYNYAKHYYRTLGAQRGIRTIYGMTGAQSLPLLAAAAANLENDATNDYWEATEGNAKSALLDLITLATMCPAGVWDGD